MTDLFSVSNIDLLISLEQNHLIFSAQNSGAPNVNFGKYPFGRRFDFSLAYLS